MRRSFLALVVVLVGLIPVASAHAAGGAEAILRDCQDDQISGTYTQAEYTKALKAIGTDSDEYTNCRAVIEAARTRVATPRATQATNRASATPTRSAQSSAAGTTSSAGGSTSTSGASAASGSAGAGAATTPARTSSTSSSDPAQVASAAPAAAPAAAAVTPAATPPPVSGAIVGAGSLGSEDGGAVDPGQVAIVLSGLALVLLAFAVRQGLRARSRP